MLVRKIDIHVHTTSWKDDMPRFNGARFATPDELCDIYQLCVTRNSGIVLKLLKIDK